MKLHQIIALADKLKAITDQVSDWNRPIEVRFSISSDDEIGTWEFSHAELTWILEQIYEQDYS